MVVNTKLWPDAIVASTAVIHPSSHIGEGAVIHDYVVIEANVTIGRNVTIYPHTVIGRTPKGAGSVVNKPTNIVGRTVISDDCVIGSGVTIYAGVNLGAEVLIGDGVRMRENCRIGYQSIVGSNCTFQQNVSMGVRSRVIDLSHITAGVIIGDDVFISTGVLTMNDNSFNRSGDLRAPVFEDESMVGGNATILPGVRVGAKARVAAGATATKSVKPGTTVWGVPAKPKERHQPSDPVSISIPVSQDVAVTFYEHTRDPDTVKKWVDETIKWEEERGSGS